MIIVEILGVGLLFLVALKGLRIYGRWWVQHCNRVARINRVALKRHGPDGRYLAVLKAAGRGAVVTGILISVLSPLAQWLASIMRKI